MSPKSDFVIFIFSFVLRLLLLCVVFRNVTYFSPDSFDYLYLARNIVENNTYGSLSNPELFRVPFYPLMISGFMVLFKENFIFTLLYFQIILDSLTAVLVMKSAHFLFKENIRNIGFIAGALYAVSPVCIIYSSKVLSETVFVFFLAVLFFLSLRAVNYKSLNSKHSLDFIIIGALAGVLCLIRAVFVPASVLFLLWISLKIKKVKYILMLIIAFSLIQGAWILRNYYASGYVGITTVSAVNMYRYDACSVLARINSINVTEQQKKIDEELNKFLTQGEVARYCTEKAFSVLRAHPFLYVYLQCKNSLNTFLPAANDLFESFGITIGGKGTLGVIQSKGLFEGIKHYFNDKYELLWIAFPMAIMLFIFYAIVIFGIFKAIKVAERMFVWDHLFILLLLLYFFIAGGAASTPRFRIPMEPFLCIYAAVGIFFLIKIPFLRKKFYEKN